MTRQETFNTVYRHAKKQGCKAQSADGVACWYRGPNGTKCFAGCLLPDELYDEALEGNGVFCNALAHCDGQVLMQAHMASLGHDLLLVRALQLIHDKHPIEHWDSEFKNVAMMFELDWVAARWPSYE